MFIVGYIPATDDGHGLNAEQITMDDFDEHLGSRYCDFLPRVLFEQKRISEERKRELDALNLIKIEHEKQEQEAVLATKRHIEEVFRHDKTRWNPAVLDYIDELNETIPGKAVSKEEKIDELEKEKELTAIDMQPELEHLWSSLFMPLDQKLDMAIKYGSHKSSQILQVNYPNLGGVSLEAGMCFNPKARETTRED